jgi:hypothetical protein
MFLEAIAAFADRNDDDPEPKVSYELNFGPHEIEISKACAIRHPLELQRYSSRAPLPVAQRLRVELKRQTYAAAAHAMLESIRMLRKVPN